MTRCNFCRNCLEISRRSRTFASHFLYMYTRIRVCDGKNRSQLFINKHEDFTQVLLSSGDDSGAQ